MELMQSVTNLFIRVTVEGRESVKEADRRKYRKTD